MRHGGGVPRVLGVGAAAFTHSLPSGPAAPLHSPSPQPQLAPKRGGGWSGTEGTGGAGARLHSAALENALAALDAAERGAAPPEVLSQRKSLVVELSNQHAVQLLAKGELPACFQLLDGCTRLLPVTGDGLPASPLAAVTANNLACYFRRRGQLERALAQLRRAAEIESRCDVPRGPADTQINLCVVLSEMGRHGEALAHAKSALALIEAEDRRASGGGGAAGGTAGGGLSVDRVAVHASALHNLSAEQACLGQTEAALVSRNAAWRIAEGRLGRKHPVTLAIRASFDAVAGATIDGAAAAHKAHDATIGSPVAAAAPCGSSGNSSARGHPLSAEALLRDGVVADGGGDIDSALSHARRRERELSHSAGRLFTRQQLEGTALPSRPPLGRPRAVGAGRANSRLRTGRTGGVVRDSQFPRLVSSRPASDPQLLMEFGFLPSTGIGGGGMGRGREAAVAGVAGATDELFDAMDANGDGVVSRGEFAAFVEGVGGAGGSVGGGGSIGGGLGVDPQWPQPLLASVAAPPSVAHLTVRRARLSADEPIPHGTRRSP